MPEIVKVYAKDTQAILGNKSGLARAQALWGKNDLKLTREREETTAAAKERAKAELQRRGLEYITANGSCIGNPILVSRTVIELDGLGTSMQRKVLRDVDDPHD